MPTRISCTPPTNETTTRIDVHPGTVNAPASFTTIAAIPTRNERPEMRNPTASARLAEPDPGKEAAHEAIALADRPERLGPPTVDEPEVPHVGGNVDLRRP